MLNSGYKFAGLFLKLLGVFFLSVYWIWTRLSYPDNTMWYALALLLFAIGSFGKLQVTLASAFAGILVYGGFEMYLLYFTRQVHSVGWNDLLWLAVFPFMALLGSIRLSSAAPGHDAAANLTLYQQMQEDELEPELSGDHASDFLQTTAFLYKLEEEVLRALRERRKFTLLLVEIERFREYKHIFGLDPAKSLLHWTTNIFQEAAEHKAYLGEGLLAAILDDQAKTPDEVMQSLDEQFYQMLLTRPRRESNLKLKLKYGLAECPQDGIDARSLMEAAQQQIRWNGTARK